MSIPPHLSEFLTTLKTLYEQGHRPAQIAEIVGKSIGHISTQLAKMGFVTQVTKRFSETEASFVIAHYGTMGDTELAKRLTACGYPRNKKQVSKFRFHKKLDRTHAQLKAIHDKHRQAGVWANNIKNCHTSEALAKRAESMRKTWKREKWRAENGLSPITGLGNRRQAPKMFTDAQIIEIRALKRGEVIPYCTERGIKTATAYAIRHYVSYRNVTP
jgi:hypothetical protein